MCFISIQLVDAGKEPGQVIKLPVCKERGWCSCCTSSSQEQRVQLAVVDDLQLNNYQALTLFR